MPKVNRLQFVCAITLAQVTLAGCLLPPDESNGASTTSNTSRALPRVSQWQDFPNTYNWTANQPNSTYFMAKFVVHDTTTFQLQVNQNVSWSSARVWDQTMGIQTWGRPNIFVTGILAGGGQTSCHHDGREAFVDQCQLKDWPTPPQRATMGTTLEPGTYLAIQQAYGAHHAQPMTFHGGFSNPIDLLWTDEGTTRLLTLRGPGADQTYTRGEIVTQELSQDFSRPFCAELGNIDGKAVEINVTDGKTQLDFYGLGGGLNPDGHSRAPQQWFLRQDPRPFSISRIMCGGAGHWEFRMRIETYADGYPPVGVLAVTDNPRIVNATGTIDAIGPGAFSPTQWPAGSYIDCENQPPC